MMSNWESSRNLESSKAEIKPEIPETNDKKDSTEMKDDFGDCLAETEKSKGQETKEDSDESDDDLFAGCEVSETSEDGSDSNQEDDDTDFSSCAKESEEDEQKTVEPLKQEQNPQGKELQPQKEVPQEEPVRDKAEDLKKEQHTEVAAEAAKENTEVNKTSETPEMATSGEGNLGYQDIKKMSETNSEKLQNATESKESMETELRERFDNLQRMDNSTPEFKEELNSYNSRMDEKEKLDGEITVLRNEQERLIQLQQEIGDEEISKGQKAMQDAETSMQTSDELEQRYVEITAGQETPSYEELNELKEQNNAILTEMSAEKESIDRAIEVKSDRISENEPKQENLAFKPKEDPQQTEMKAELSSMEDTSARLDESISKIQDNNSRIDEKLNTLSASDGPNDPTDHYKEAENHSEMAEHVQDSRTDEVSPIVSEEKMDYNDNMGANTPDRMAEQRVYADLYRVHDDNYTVLPNHDTPEESEKTPAPETPNQSFEQAPVSDDTRDEYEKKRESEDVSPQLSVNGESHLENTQESEQEHDVRNENIDSFSYTREPKQTENADTHTQKDETAETKAEALVRDNSDVHQPYDDVKPIEQPSPEDSFDGSEKQNGTENSAFPPKDDVQENEFRSESSPAEEISEMDDGTNDTTLESANGSEKSVDVASDYSHEDSVADEREQYREKAVELQDVKETHDESGEQENDESYVEGQNFNPRKDVANAFHFAEQHYDVDSAHWQEVANRHLENLKQEMDEINVQLPVLKEELDAKYHDVSDYLNKTGLSREETASDAAFQKLNKEYLKINNDYEKLIAKRKACENQINYIEPSILPEMKTTYRGMNGADFNDSYNDYITEPQGHAVPGFGGVCGINETCSIVNQQTGSDLGEADGVKEYVAHGWCKVNSSYDENGGTLPEDRREFLNSKGLSFHRIGGYYDTKVDVSLDEVAQRFNNGESAGLILRAQDLSQSDIERRKTGLQWFPKSNIYYANHATTIAGFSYKQDGKVAGVWINDTGGWAGEGVNRVYIDAEKFNKMQRNTKLFSVEFSKKR